MSAQDQVAAAAQDTRRVRVHRFKRDDGPAHIEEHDVPVEARTTVLEALRWIQLHDDPTLALRHSCFHASCGTCGVRVNGRERLACVTPLADVGGGTVTVEPIANLPVLNDLVVDMTSFVAAVPRGASRSCATASSCPRPKCPMTSGRTMRFEDCIECGLCLSACPVAATDDSYVGPAALAFAQRMLEEDPGTVDRDALLDWADQDIAAWRCHAAFECTEACPSNVRPAQRIMALRKDLRRRRRDQGRASPRGRIGGGQRERSSEPQDQTPGGVEEILRARGAQGPVERKAPGPTAWFDIRRRGTGHFAFSLNRITGLGLVFYLYLHLAVLSQLLGGEAAWNGFLELATTPLFLGLDVLLVFGLLAHGLNGLRVALIGSGFVPNRQKALF